MSLLGIEDEFSLGLSFFSNKEFVCTNAGTIITKDLYYNSTKWFDIKTAQIVDTSMLDENEQEKLQEYIKCMELELNISKAYPIVR